MATAEPAGQPLEPTDADAVRKRLDALKPEPWPADYAALGQALAETGTHFGGAVWLSDGLGGDDATAFARTLSSAVKGAMVVYSDAERDLFGLKPATAGTDALTAPVIRRLSGDCGGRFRSRERHQGPRRRRGAVHVRRGGKRRRTRQSRRRWNCATTSCGSTSRGRKRRRRAAPRRPFPPQAGGAARGRER